jgi:hypothetical protein
VKVDAHENWWIVRLLFSYYRTRDHDDIGEGNRGDQANAGKSTCLERY